MAGASKVELLDALRSSADEVLGKLRALAPQEWERGCYENGWNAREILAHIASIEWAYPRLIDLARSALSSDQSGSGEPPTRAARGGIDDYNQRQVDKRATATIDELIEEFERNRAATIDAVTAAEDDLFEVPIRSAGGITGPMGEVMDRVAVQHIVMHARDILGEPGGWAG